MQNYEGPPSLTDCSGDGIDLNAPKTTIPAHKVEIARRAFGDALSNLVNIKTRLGDVPVQALREAMATALEAVKDV